MCYERIKGIHMRLSAKERIICCIFAVILLVLGMWSSMGTDSSFAYHASTSVTSSIREVDKIFQMEEICTNEMLQKDNAMYLRSNVRKNFTKILFGIAVLTCIVALGLQYLFYLKRAKRWEYGDKLTSHAFNVNYIHKQDGEK